MTDMACPSTLTDAFSITPPERMLELEEASNSPLANFLVVKRKEKDKLQSKVYKQLSCASLLPLIRHY